MAETARAGRTAGRRARTALDAVLALVALALAALVALLLLRGGDGGDDAATALSRSQAALTRDAGAQVQAFLTVDHADMDPLVDAVLAGATGSFREEYAADRDRLVASARAGRSVSTGTVRAVAVQRLDGAEAQVLVAADSVVTNTETDGSPEQRTHRFALTLVREGDRWLTSDLEFVR